MVGRIELAERAVLQGDNDAGGLEALGAGEPVRVAHELAALGVTRDVGHVVADLDHGRLLAEVRKQGPRVVGLLGVEGVERLRHPSYTLSSSSILMALPRSTLYVISSSRCAVIFSAYCLDVGQVVSVCG